MKKDSTLKRIFSMFWSENKVKFMISIFFMILSAISAYLIFKAQFEILDKGIVPYIGTNDISMLLKSGLLFIIFQFLMKIFDILRTQIMIKVSQDTQLKFRKKLFDKIQKLPMSFFEKNKIGDILTRISKDVDAIDGFITETLPNILFVSLKIIGVLVFMFSLNVLLTFIALGLVIIGILTMKNTIKRIVSSYTDFSNKTGELNGYISETLKAQRVIKVFNYEERNTEKFNKINTETEKIRKNVIYNETSIWAFVEMVQNFQFVLIIIIGILLALNGFAGMTIAVLVSFGNATRSLSYNFNEITTRLSGAFMAIAGAKRVFEILDENSEIDEGYISLVNIKKDGEKIIEKEEQTNMWAWKINKTRNPEYVELKGHIEFENVEFGYVEKKKVLKSISFYAKPGQKIAFVGATGAGKTTITTLLNRFYEINSGKILYDGINIKDIKKDDLRKSLGMVLQDVNLFTGTIKENIRYGKIDASDEEVIESAKLANAHEFIEMLPEGYDTILTENGAELSQGQKQLISIARAAINNPPVMILDEATASIDTRTEKLVQDGMDKLMENRTVLVIAHRLSTVKNSKAILVMANGEIIERGTHEDLISQKGEYYELYTGGLELE